MKRQKCEKFSRAMGYYRPVENFNVGKHQEYTERKTFGENTIFASIKRLFKKGVPNWEHRHNKGGYILRIMPLLLFLIGQLGLPTNTQQEHL